MTLPQVSQERITDLGPATEGRWTKAQVRRAVHAVEAVGLSIEGVEIWPDGRLRVLTAPVKGEAEFRSANDWTEHAGEKEVSRA